ncbi:MAG: hypothetical protein GY851_08370 [bacterium]|nr:hypothetical protein [bacterium]
MFGSLFRRKQQESTTSDLLIVAQLNARLHAAHLATFFDDPLDEALQKLSIGKISGGGAIMLLESGEIEYCDIEILLREASEEPIAQVIAILEGLGAPRGSKLKIEGQGAEIAFGKDEGMAVYLNGTDLPPEVYAESDVNHVIAEFDRLLADSGRILSYFEGAAETAFYMYGDSFGEMKSKISGFLESYPLCRKCRVEQIA